MSLVARSYDVPKRDYTSADEVINFGKHRGRAIGDVIDSDPGWIDWALGAEVVTLSRPLLDRLDNVNHTQDDGPRFDLGYDPFDDTFK